MPLELVGGRGQKEAVRESGAGAIRQAAETAAEWQVDVVPLQMRIEAEASARPCAVLVTAGGFVLDHEMLDRPVPEPDAVAEPMVRSVRKAMRRVGAVPKALRVRRPEMVEALAARIDLLASKGADDGVAQVPIDWGDLDELDDAAFSLIEAMGGAPARYFACRPEAWSAWGLPEETVARVFSAAAGFFRAAPWEVLANVDALEIEVPSPPGADHRTWTATIMGMGGEEYGIALYSEPGDFWALFEAPEWAPDDEVYNITGEVISLSFDPGHAVPGAMRREIARAGWEVAGAAAYPSIITINTLAGGLPRADAEALAAILEAVPRFAEQHAKAIEANRPVPPETDRETGLTITYRAEAAERVAQNLHEAGTGDDEYEDWDLEFPGSLTVLTPGSTEGPGAEPEAVLEQVGKRSFEEYQAHLDGELEITERFAEHLRTAAGLKEATVERHWSNADLFVRFLVDTRGVPVRAMHEYDLRMFLFDWYPRKVMASLTEARSVPVSLKRFFEYVAAAEGVICRWAQPILAARDTFEERWETCPGSFFADGAVIDWRMPHEGDLMVRCMIPTDRLGDDAEWGGMMGPREAELMTELHARWLLWRDEAIRAGHPHPDELKELLLERQHAWETAPLPRLDGKTPYEVVVAEQAERAERDREG